VRSLVSKLTNLGLERERAHIFVVVICISYVCLYTQFGWTRGFLEWDV